MADSQFLLRIDFVVMVSSSKATLTVGEPENRFPRFLTMKLDAEVKDSGESWSQVMTDEGNKTNAEIQLTLSINFDDESFDIPHVGRILFGLNGGTLSLLLTGGEIPNDRNYRFFKGRSVAEGTEKTAKPKSNFSNNGTDSLGKDKGTVVFAEEPEGQSANRKFPLNSYQVRCKGSTTNPKWVFSQKDNEGVLLGGLDDMHIGTAIVQKEFCRIEAEFSVGFRDVITLDLSDALGTEVTNNQLIILSRAYAHYFLQNRVKPYLSRQVINYE